MADFVHILGEVQVRMRAKSEFYAQPSSEDIEKICDEHDLNLPLLIECLSRLEQPIYSMVIDVPEYKAWQDNELEARNYG